MELVGVGALFSDVSRDSAKLAAHFSGRLQSIPAGLSASRCCVHA